MIILRIRKEMGMEKFKRYINIIVKIQVFEITIIIYITTITTIILAIISTLLR